jgi:hypothetical protein
MEVEAGRADDGGKPQPLRTPHWHAEVALVDARPILRSNACIAFLARKGRTAPRLGCRMALSGLDIRLIALTDSM